MPKQILYILIGAIVLVLLAIGLGVYALLPTITSASANQAVTPTPVISATITPMPKGNGAAKLLKQYAPSIKNQVAAGLHLTPDQLTAQLKSGKTLSAIATTQNVSSTQLQTIVGSALQSGLKPAVDNGTLTQQQLDKLVKRFQNNPTLLDRILMLQTTTNQ